MKNPSPSPSKTTNGAFLDALRQPDARNERPRMSTQARANLRKLMAVLRAEIATNASTMTPPQKKKIQELARVLEAHLCML